MNILFITYQGDIAGSTNSISYLAKGLAERGHNVYLGARKEALLFSMLEGTKVNLLPMTFKSKVDFENMRQIREAVHEYNIDLVNAQSSKDRYTTIFARWFYGLRYKLVHTRRQISKSAGGLMNLFYEKGTDRVVAVSNGVKASLVNQGMNPKHINVIYNGTPEEKYNNVNPEKTAAFRQKYGIGDDDFVVGCVARRKHQNQLLEALKYIEEPVAVLCVGIEKSPEDELIIDSYKTAHKVHFTGTVASEDVLSFYPLFDVKVLPSTIEGLSQSLLEAMYLKVPVVATAAAGNVDLVQHRENGLLFEDGDVNTLTKLLVEARENQALRELLIKNGYQTAAVTFSITNTVNNYESFFNELITG